MNLQPLIPLVFFILIALGAALVLVLVFGATLHAETRFRRVMLPLVLPIVLVGVALSTLTGGRNLAFGGSEILGTDGGAALQQISATGSATWPLRFLTMIILALSIALTVGAWARWQPVLKSGGSLILSFWLFFATNVVLNSALGSQPDFVPNHFYPIVVFLAAYYSRDQPSALITQAAKFALLTFLAASLVMVVLNRSLVLQQPYLQGWIPGLKFRLWGLSSHANSIGPLALLYVLLEIYSPFKSRLLRWLAFSIALAVIVLAQSKTVWVIGLLLVGLMYAYKVVPRFHARWRSGRIDSRVVLQLSLAMVVSSLLLVMLLAIDTDRYTDRFFRSTAGAQLSSLSGRSGIWLVAIDVWKQNPLFGYGPRLWDPEFRQSIGMSFAFHAHNQFLQSLSSAGLFGIVGAVVYLAVLGFYSLKFAVKTAGFTIALWCFLFVRCLTETPLSVGTLFNGDFFTHLMVFAFLVRVVAEEQPSAVAVKLPVAARLRPT